MTRHPGGRTCGGAIARAAAALAAITALITLRRPG